VSNHCYGVSANPSLIQSIVLPNDTTYTFEYDSVGNLAELILPTGGSISYHWGQVGVSTSYIAEVLGERTVTDANGPHLWTYSGWKAILANPEVVTVADPLGNQAVHTFTNFAGGPAPESGYETSAQTYNGSSSSGTLLKTVATAYASVYPGQPTSAGAVVPSTITTTWPNGKVSQMQKTYDTGISVTGESYKLILGQVTQQQDYDYGTNAPGALLRITNTVYEAVSGSSYLTNGLVNLPASVQILDGGGTQRAYTTYSYDQTALATSSVPSTLHDLTPPDGTYRGNQTSVSRWLNTTGGSLTSTKTFFDTGEVNIAKDPKNNLTTYAYSLTYEGAYPTTITNALNQATTNVYDFNTGLLTSTTDPNSQPTTYSYDPETLRKTQTTYPDGGQTNICYSDTASEGCAYGPPYQAIITKKITSAITLSDTEVFDVLGRSSESELTSDPSGTDYTVTTYDDEGRKATVTNPYRTTSDSTYGITQYSYDALNRTTTVTKPDNSTVTTASCGPTTLVTDEAGHWRRSTVDGLGRLIEVDEPNSTTATVNSSGCPGTNDPVWVTTCAYDVLGDLTSVVQGGSRNRTFVFDSLKRLTSSINPETGTNPVLYTYDSDSNVLTKKDGRSITITYAWDALNRMTSRTYSNGDPTVSYTYDSTTCVVVTSCYNIGRRTGMTDAAGTESWAYDKMGREWGEQRTINSVTKTTSYTYNLDGTLATQTYPSGRLITYTVNAASQLTSAEDVANGIPYVSNAFYAPTGAIAIYNAGALSNYTTIYNNRLQPCWSYANTGSSSLPVNTACTGTATAATVLDLKYNFHLGTDNGNIYSVTNDRDTTRSQTFTYDQVNRIVTAQSNTTCGSNCWTQAFTYDQWANLTTAVATGSPPPLTISVNANNQVFTTPFAFDAAGNETADVTSTYAWNAESEMKTGGGVNYTYDGDGDRVQKSNGKIYWYGAGSEILDETDATGSITNATFGEYIYFDGKRAARRDYQSNLFYYFADQVGSARGMFEVASGSNSAILCFDADFYPFGSEHDFTNTCPQNYKFMGKERDPETNNDDFGARSYASAYGRFLSADWSSTPSPVPYANLTNPQTLNLYAMVSDNPESFADLDGHEQQIAQAAAGYCTDSALGSCNPLSTAQSPGTAQGLHVKVTVEDPDPDVVSFKDKTGIGVLVTYTFTDDSGKPIVGASVKEENTVSDGGTIKENQKTLKTDKDGTIPDAIIKGGSSATAPSVAVIKEHSNNNPINMSNTQTMTVTVGNKSYQVTTTRTLSNVNSDGSLKTALNSHGLNTTFTPGKPEVTSQ
jgi:RHS repeat-associated protein